MSRQALRAVNENAVNDYPDADAGAGGDLLRWLPPLTESRSVEMVGYEAASRTLGVEYKTGAVDYFYDVPADVHTDLLGASSAGGFIHAHIRGRYERRNMARARAAALSEL